MSKITLNCAAVLAVLLLCSCVRYGYQEQTGDLTEPDFTVPTEDGASLDLAVDRALPDLVVPDTEPAPDSAPLCPGAMANLGTFCIDKDDSSSVMWTRAVEHCMSQGKRLCSATEWVTACQSSGKGMIDMTGTYEWIYELANDTAARKLGSSTCASASSCGAAVSTCSYQPRCCLTLSLAISSAMADFGTFYIDKDDSGSLTWVRAAEHCMSLGKRLCSVTEWVTACQSSGKGMIDMTGTYEWTYELHTDTSAKKVGSSTCASASDAGVASSGYQTRCCAD